MTSCTVTFQPMQATVTVPVGTLIVEAAQAAGLDLHVPCGGQGRCGRCAVVVDNGNVRRRSSLRLSPADLAQGYALACQTVIEGDTEITLLPQEKVERRLTTDRTAPDNQMPLHYDPAVDQPLRALYVELEPPSLADQTDDWSRLQRSCAGTMASRGWRPTCRCCAGWARTLRDADWQVTAIVESDTWQQPDGPARLVDLLPGRQTERLLGAALDIGTTSNVVYLVDLLSGKVLARAVDYNGQITRGEDVISRIIYAGKNNGLDELQELVIETFNRLLDRRPSASTRQPRTSTRRPWPATAP